MKTRITTSFMVVFFCLLSVTLCHAEELSLFSGPKSISSGTSVSIPASALQDIGVGDVIRVYTSGAATNSGFSVNLTTNEGNSLFSDEPSFKAYGDFSLIVSTSCLSTLASSGLSISGGDFTIEEVVLEKDPREKLLFSGSVSISYYTPTISIPKFQFANARVGDVVKVKVDGLSADSRGCLQNADWSELKLGYSGFELTGDYSMTIDEDVLRQLRSGVLRVRGAYHTVKKVTLYCPNSGFSLTGEKRPAPMLFGLNESGGEFAGVYPGRDGTHYGYPDRQDLAYAAKKGFRIIRLPFRWERVLRPLGSTKLIDTEIKKIKQVLDWAEELNIRVILDMHNFGRYCTYCNGTSSADNVYAVIGESSCTVDHFCDVWRLLAQEFKGYQCIWAYEIMNEPYSMRSDTPWYNIAQSCIYAIREYDTETPILVDGDSFASARLWQSVSDNLRNLNDPADNLIYTAHCYFDKNSSGEYTESYNRSGATDQTGIQRTKPFVEWCVKYGKRGFVGEYGIPDDDSRWNTLLENTLRYLQENGIGGTYWSAGHRWGDYKLAVHPTGNYTTDRPQMTVLEKFLSAEDPESTSVEAPMAGSGISTLHHSGSYFDIMGRKYDSVEALPKGIYIHNGKKFAK